MSKTATRAILLDLDDTLLINNMDTFGSRYFSALMDKVEGVCLPGKFMTAMTTGIRAMMSNDGADGTNAEVFYRAFFPRIDLTPDEIMPLLDEFYAQDFEALRGYTGVDPLARTLVELLFERGYQVAIATQPMFPKIAILARLRWAGVDADTYAYDFISCFEVMSACKPHPHFFRAILETLGRAPEECLMVGDSPDSDMPARRVGLKTFWVNRGYMTKPPRMRCDAEGDLQELITLVQTGRIDEL